MAGHLLIFAGFPSPSVTFLVLVQYIWAESGMIPTCGFSFLMFLGGTHLRRVTIP